MNPVRPAFAAAALVSLAATARAEHGVGEPLPAVPLLEPSRAAPAPLLAKGRPCLFLIFRPGQKHALEGLAAAAALQREFEPRGVRFAAIITDAYSPSAAAEALSQAGAKMPLFVDRGEELFARLSVDATPAAGIADARGMLVAYEPYRRIQFKDILRARLRFALGDIGPSELDRALAPEDASEKSASIAARRYLALARRLFESGDRERARHSAAQALEKDPSLAEAQALLGQIALAQGDCPPALEAFRAALALDPGNAEATAGQGRCARPRSVSAPPRETRAPAASGARP